MNEAALAAAEKSGEPQAPAPEGFKVAKGFKVELLYSVPKDEQGSWVSMCVDPKGRLIVSDQYGGLYRVTPPPLGGDPATTKVEKIAVDIGEAQGLLWAFDSLYVVVNSGEKYESGLYRVTRHRTATTSSTRSSCSASSNGGGEHGPHAVLLTPDGKSLYVVCGNQTKLTELAGSRVPPVWGEDHLLPRCPTAAASWRACSAPGGCDLPASTPTARTGSCLSIGFRNQYDAAFNRHGDLFTYDADMEWDFNTPGIGRRASATSTSGSEFGWRNGAGKWPAYYPDSLPAVVDIGPGSPTGVTLRLRGEVPGEVSGRLLHLRLELRQALRRPPARPRRAATRASSRSSSPARRCR